MRGKKEARKQESELIGRSLLLLNFRWLRVSPIVQIRKLHLTMATH